MDIRAVIFDLDGVIVDTAQHHFLAWRRLAEELGIACPPDLKDRVRGISRMEALRIVLGDAWPTYQPQARELADRKDAYYRELIEGLGPQDLLPGVAELVADLKGNRVKVGVATGSRNGKTVLARLGILAEFDAIVDGHSGAESKPAPDLFLYAARALGIPPSQCLVIEDAPAGVLAAELAGMHSLAIGEEKLFSGVRPDLVLPGLAGLTRQGLLRALAEATEGISTWLVEAGDELSPQARETVLAVGNGYLSTRGTYEEKHPGELRATLINGVYDPVPIYFTELANCPDWTRVELEVEGERFSPGSGRVLTEGRTLDLRDGVLRRRVRWRTPRGQQVEIQTMRFASLAEPHLCLQSYAVTPLTEEVQVRLEVPLEAAPGNPGLPPLPEVPLNHWEVLASDAEGRQVHLLLRTRRSGIELAASLGVRIHGVPEERVEVQAWSGPCPGLSLTVRLSPGETLQVAKFVAYATSLETSAPLPCSRAQLAGAGEKGVAELLSEHRAAWGRLWARCDVEIAGDELAQRAVRFNLYQLLIAAPYHTDRASIPAKALTGFGYRGHVFWDTDVFMLPFFALTLPEVARNLLLYRHHTLPGARENARERGYAGARYAWESADDGREVTPRWVPAASGEPIPILCGELEQHISADVAYAVWSYWQASGDAGFMCDQGAEILLATAAFWASIARYDPAKERYEIRGVMGPDEYHERVDNNAFTNAMARWNIEVALDALDWLRHSHPEKAEGLERELGLTGEELARWREVARRMYVPQDPASGLIEQFEGFFQLEEVNLAELAPRTRSLQALLGREGVQQAQVLKQPDVLMLLYLLRDRYDERTVRANWDYYEPRTDHEFGSSLGPPIHAALACELGEIEVAYRHFLRAALVDLEDLRGNTAEGVHAASAGGVWQAVVFGFAGLRLTPTGPVARPRLPGHWKRLRFSIRYRGRRYVFDLTPGMAGPVSPLPGER
ncbi:TPA: beta-phosphoglucomutase [Candidatus Bipolaricaulota bacterium]|nr:beta-phosphoglucomutase [Candidatus Bipolaricaulota bacterium]